MKRNWKIRMGKWRRYFLFLGEYLFLEKPRGLDFTMRDTRILDVGCGKGVVLKEAAGFPFERIAGIELQEGLVETAERNFRILKSRKNDSPMTFIYHNPQYLDVLEGRAERFARDPARIRKAEEGNKMKRNWPNVNVPAEWEKKDIYKPVFLNWYGYYELRRQNTPEERGRNFEENYFQNYAGQTYAKEYPESELAFIRNKIEERELVIRENLQKAGKNPEEGYSLLDIGCGEGFLLKHFYDRGVRVKGIDFGVYALKHFHPELCSCFEQGDMMKLLPQMAARGEVYDVVNADRMLDMVPDAGEDGGGIPSAGRNGIWPGDCGGFSERMNSARTY